MSHFKIVFFIVWLIASLRRQLLLSFWWQTKEYRIDRFWVFLKTKTGFLKTDGLFLALKLGLLPLLLLFPLAFSFYLVLIISETLAFMREISARQLRRPKLTFRSLCLLAGSFSPIALAFLFYQNWLFLLTIDLASYFILIFPILITWILTQVAIKNSLGKARVILRKTNPKVVAITGSYGKSSTKHLLAAILQNQVSVVSTPESYNTLLGIIQTIFKDLKPKTKYFICELGAYKKGEISNICRFLSPDYALITGITDQHLALFGSQKNLIQAKYEIARNLKQKGILFINNSRPSVAPLIRLAQADKQKIITYALARNQTIKADFLAKVVKSNKDSTFLKLKTPTKTIPFTTNLVALPLLENLVGCLAVALTLKISKKALQASLLQLPTTRLKTVKLSANFTLIDDSFNSNPVGFGEAIDYLAKKEGFKIVVTEGIQELGKAADSYHLDMGRKMKSLDLILTPSPETAKLFCSGLENQSSKLHLIKPNLKTEELKNLINTPATILLEGRLPAQLIKTAKELK